MVDQNRVLELHERHTGVLGIQGELPVTSRAQLAEAYTPGVAGLAKLIEKDPSAKKKYTVSGKLVAVVTDGSAVLGLGNIGPAGGLPIVEGKSLLYKQLADVDAIPMTLEQVSADEFVDTVANFAGSFAGIHLEDIAAPKVFEIEEKLRERLDIPVYHDDQTGTAIVVLAGLINAAKVVGKPLQTLRVVINGVGAAGVATSKLLLAAGIRHQTLVDIHGEVTPGDTSYNRYQRDLAAHVDMVPGETLDDVIADADVFIGVSVDHVLDGSEVEKMADSPIIFALANPVPEIDPDEAFAAGAKVVATGSSQWANQVNNILVFPGLFKGLLEYGVNEVSVPLQLRVAQKLASLIDHPTADRVVPGVFDEGVVKAVEGAVAEFKEQ
ncbi:NAD-dependent malic enzyme [Bifidobacterium sp. ESL0682]|uniref:NAD(P)-dependent malic enzyme n=1 Tax=Bifidobacterium sp. ESL0682 TaxID=2983212 RepID=UPI0023F6724E|nr:malic enzyme-like NAD(P)-binding protein [Bifidobacterium sp. ESL0682]WEV41772.1 NAD-dependent malic enzyme [Bifidobacterium sp. ESL0682]